MRGCDVSVKAKVRGIYSTALTRLLLDSGFEIVQPSFAIIQRFSLHENSALPDIEIKDRYDLQGVRALGKFDAISVFQSVLQSAFDDVLARRWPVSVDGIYTGRIVDEDEETVYVDIGNEVTGWLPKSETSQLGAEHVVVQVERKRMGAKHPVLTSQLKIVREYAILAQNCNGGVSLKIRDLNKRCELYELGKTLAPENWGIIWREPSANQSRETLENEVTILAEKARILNEKVSSEAPVLLVDGSFFMDVEFPSLSKKRLDQLRASVAETLPDHHFYKSCGGAISSALEMAEKLLEKGEDKSKVEEWFKEQILRESPEEGSTAEVEHVKPSGYVFYLGQATIDCIDETHVKYSRIIRSNGSYDGLDVAKEAGDKATSEARLGEWYITTRYFSKDGELKGTYVNINTPVEVYPDAIRYVDLEVDVCILPNGAVKVLDMEKLEKAFEKGIISQKLFAKVKETVKKILEK
jgi:hypothetical protein